MAKRILGMGDVLTFIEKAQESFDEETAMKMAEKCKQDALHIMIFRSNSSYKKMGSLKGLLSMIPGLGSQIKNLNIDEKNLFILRP